MTASHILAAVLILPSLFAQTSGGGIDGVWQGALLFGQGKMRVILYVAPPRDGAYAGALIYLESGSASNLDRITFSKGKVGLELRNLKFEGSLSPSGSEIKGKFTQGEASGDLNFVRGSESSSKVADDYDKHEHMIPMRDGVHLHTIVFSPKVHTEALPFLIERSPYGWDSAAVSINTG